MGKDVNLNGPLPFAEKLACLPTNKIYISNKGWVKTGYVKILFNVQIVNQTYLKET